MRISDWSSDVCSSDLACLLLIPPSTSTSMPLICPAAGLARKRIARATDRKSVVSGKSVSVRVELGGRRIIKKKNKQKHRNNTLRTTKNNNIITTSNTETIDDSVATKTPRDMNI